jgi:hypothetical protein
MFQPPSGGALFSNSKCFEVCECSFQRIDNTIIFDYSSLSRMRANKELLQEVSSCFKNPITTRYFNSILDIMEHRMDLWETKLVIDLINMPSLIHWEKIQLIYTASKPAFTKPKEKSIQKGMPDEYRFEVDDSHQDYGYTLRADEKDEDISLQVGPYNIRNKDGGLFVIHPSFGTRHFDAIAVYGDNHMVGWDEDGYNHKFNYILFTPNNITRSFEYISKCCYSGWHIGKNDGSTYLLDSNNARESAAPRMGWDDIEEIHESTAVVVKGEDISIIDTQSFDLMPRDYLNELDLVQWQRNEIFFVKKGQDWRVYNGKDKRISHRYRDIRWVSKDLICASDGGSLFVLFNPDKDVTSLIYRGESPVSFLEKDKKSTTAQNNREYNKPVANSAEGIVQLSDTNSVGVEAAPMSVLIIEERYAIRKASSLYSSVIHYSLPSTITTRGLGYVYIFTPHDKKLYITSFENKNKLEVINEINLDSFPDDINISRYPLVFIEKETFKNDNQIVAFILDKIEERKSNTAKHKKVSTSVSSENRLPSIKKETKSIEKVKVTHKKPVQKQLPIPSLTKPQKVMHLPAGTCYYKIGKEKILKRGAGYDSGFFGRTIKSNGTNNYYLNYGKDIIIIVPEDTINTVKDKAEYELIGSGQDPRIPQTFGQNANGKIQSQSITGIRILVFYKGSSDKYYFFDEVKYINHRITKSEKYDADIIVFTFKSLLG